MTLYLMKWNKPGMSPGHFGEFSPMSNKLFNDRRKLAKIANNVLNIAGLLLGEKRLKL